METGLLSSLGVCSEPWMGGAPGPSADDSCTDDPTESLASWQAGSKRAGELAPRQHTAYAFPLDQFATPFSLGGRRAGR